MSQHFLLSAAARTLSLSAVARMSDEEAHAKFVEIRWANNGGEPYCPKCGCLEISALRTRNLWKCRAKECHYMFSVTAQTIFADRKRPLRDYLLAITIFINGAKGHSALQIANTRRLSCSRTSYAKRWDQKFMTQTSLNYQAPSKLMGCMRAAISRRRTKRPTASIGARPKFVAASAKWSLSLVKCWAERSHSSCRARAPPFH
jgi:Transposase zinc-ribbon domain